MPNMQICKVDTLKIENYWFTKQWKHKPISKIKVDSKFILAGSAIGLIRYNTMTPKLETSIYECPIIPTVS